MKTLTKLESLAAKALEDELAAIERDRAHYQALLDAVPGRIDEARVRHAPAITEALRDAGVIEADDEVEDVAIESGKASAVKLRKAPKKVAQPEGAEKIKAKEEAKP